MEIRIMRIVSHIRMLLPLLLLVAGFSGCQDGKFNTFSLDDDKKLGQNLAKQISDDPKQYPVVKREGEWVPVYEGLEEVRDAILASGQLKHAKDFAWEVHVIDQDTRNAFCAPGGYIYFYTGLLKYLDSWDQVAGVMGHEMAHADQRHSTSQLTQRYGLDMLVQVVTGLSNAKLPGMAADLAGLAAKGGSQLAALKFSRKDESEADECSVKYLYHTKYDARGVAGFFEKMEAEKAEQRPEFISTHPSHESRVDDVKKLWKEMGAKEGEPLAAEYKKYKDNIP
ncbi:MAG: peptidase M48 [Bacteroidia bacterium]|nr:MAG: peptidase M48 [Bacteroidia bacterium]